MSGTASSAAAVGVSALTSATKSDIVKSISCPTADITGILQSNMLLANSSLLKTMRSSGEPPPLPTIKRSRSSLLVSERNLII